ncbi:hypothetical protein [Sinorhizobium meliloti]|uniref:hypothetical protein n=1 Tax=Rhizobium meliloti TaxID=382 RepID=UPI0001E4B02A|nr:hypothetical protein [Sinorhizobium meliloti]AEG53169.1 hypothetical protein Sinme_1423 [Sinorhizobium meliloti AK83]MDE4591115.1 hypothetical protein [Sinorhizobium meliloti]SEI56450.1 hypothetical protein SAMN04244575_01072 [Sinorhizobium meliloti]
MSVIVLKAKATGTHKGKPVAFEITFSNTAPMDAGQAAFNALYPGRTLALRRNDWFLQQTDKRSYCLRLFDAAGEIETDLTIADIRRCDDFEPAKPLPVEPAPAAFAIQIRAIKHVTAEYRIEAATEDEARAKAIELFESGYKWSESEPEDMQIESISRV